MSHRRLPDRLSQTVQRLETLMLNSIARGFIKRMAKRYDYDMTYALYLLAKAPKAFRVFMRAAALSRHREKAPIEAAFAVQLLATISEDCGPCTQPK